MLERMSTKPNAQGQQGCLVRDATQSKHRRARPKICQVGREIVVARRYLDRQGLVLRWQAFHRVADAAVAQHKSIPHRYSDRLVRIPIVV
jgi:hypothetical protein